MKESILRRYPTLKEDDVVLRDDGKGVYIDIWKINEPKPTITQVKLWVNEDEKLPKPKTVIEILMEENAELKRQTAQLNADLGAFMDFIFDGEGSI